MLIVRTGQREATLRRPSTSKHRCSLWRWHGVACTSSLGPELGAGGGGGWQCGSFEDGTALGGGGELEDGGSVGLETVWPTVWWNRVGEPPRPVRVWEETAQRSRAVEAHGCHARGCRKSVRRVWLPSFFFSFVLLLGAVYGFVW